MITTSDIDRIPGSDVLAGDGDKIGSAGQVYLDDESGQPEWVTVRTGLFGTKESFVPLWGARWTGERLEVPFARNRVKDAPRIEADEDLGLEDEQLLYSYYRSVIDEDGIPRSVPGDTTPDTGTYRGLLNEPAGGLGPNAALAEDERLAEEEEEGRHRADAGTRPAAPVRVRLRRYIMIER